MEIDLLKQLIREEVIDARSMFAKRRRKKDPLEVFEAIKRAIVETEELQSSLPHEQHQGLDRVLSLLKSALTEFEG